LRNIFCLNTFHYICYTLKNPFYIITILISCCFAFWFCHKDTQTTCVPTRSYLTSFTKQFQFKQGSYWVYQSNTNPNIDTMKVTQIIQKWIGYPNSPTPGNPGINPNYCDSFQGYFLENSHSYLTWGGGLIYSLITNNISMGLPYDIMPDGRPLTLINANARDSIYNGGGSEGVTYIKLENKFDTLTILGTKYNNVYQMYYSPHWNFFKRIWWCPNVGFVQFQFVNQTTSTTQIGNSDTWQLKNYHVLF